MGNGSCSGFHLASDLSEYGDLWAGAAWIRLLLDKMLSDWRFVLEIDCQKTVLTYTLQSTPGHKNKLCGKASNYTSCERLNPQHH